MGTVVEVKSIGGLRPIGDGVDGNPALGRESELAFVELGARYGLASRLGRVYSVSTAIAGVAPGNALTTSPPITLYNPKGSGKVIFPITAGCVYISGTLGTADLVLAANYDTAGAAPSGGTVITPRNTQIGNAVPGEALAYTSGVLAAIPVLVRPLWFQGVYAGATPPSHFPEVDLAGKVCLAEGASVSIQGASTAKVEVVSNRRMENNILFIPLLYQVWVGKYKFRWGV